MLRSMMAKKITVTGDFPSAMTKKVKNRIPRISYIDEKCTFNPKGTDMTDALKINPVGSVGKMEDAFSINILKEYRAGLTGLETFSHAIIIWWCSFVDAPRYRSILTMDKPYIKGPGTIGVFATRSPVRPNPIAVSTVKLIGIDADNGVLHVPYIDAEPGTPVLDVKPYHPSEDRIKNIAMPKWCSHWPMWNEDSANFNWEAEFNFPGRKLPDRTTA